MQPQTVHAPVEAILKAVGLADPEVGRAHDGFATATIGVVVGVRPEPDPAAPAAFPAARADGDARLGAAAPAHPDEIEPPANAQRTRGASPASSRLGAQAVVARPRLRRELEVDRARLPAPGGGRGEPQEDAPERSR